MITICMSFPQGLTVASQMRWLSSRKSVKAKCSLGQLATHSGSGLSHQHMCTDHGSTTTDNSISLQVNWQFCSWHIKGSESISFAERLYHDHLFLQIKTIVP